MEKPNMDIEIRNTKTGCGTSLLCYMPIETFKQLKELMSLPGLDIEMTALAYPYLQEKI